LFKQILLFVISLGISQHFNNVPFAEPFVEDPGAEFAEGSRNFEVPYEATPMAVVNAMLKMAAVGPNDFLIDLGSGDGRIVITAAKRFGARGLGVDRNQKLISLSRQYAQNEGVADRTAFTVQDLFFTDLSKADVVTLYLVPEVNLRLRPKLLKD
jgi:predicted RNA methylase